MRDQVREELWPLVGIAELERKGVLMLGRGKVISKRDLAATPGSYPVYSSAKENDGKFGEYGLYMFDEELITWSVDGGGRLFHRPSHKFSITNVGGWIRILQPDKIFCRYLHFVLSYLHSQVEFDWVRKAHPSVIRNVYTKIPLPPLEEQKQIVAMLDQAIAALDRACAHAKANLADATALLSNWVSATFVASKGLWHENSLVDVCENLDRLRVPITKSDRESGTVPYYGASGIVDQVAENIFEEDLLLVSEDGANLLARTYPIAFSITGKAWVNNHAHVLRFDDLDTQEFVRLYLNSISLEPFVTGMAQPKLNQKALNGIPIPFPEIAEQRRIVAQAREIGEASERARDRYNLQIADITQLRQSLLQKAFSGQL